MCLQRKLETIKCSDWSGIMQFQQCSRSRPLTASQLATLNLIKVRHCILLFILLFSIFKSYAQSPYQVISLKILT